MGDFDAFLAKVDKIILSQIGMGRDDIPDYCYWDNFNEGVSAEDTAFEAIEYAGFAL